MVLERLVLRASAAAFGTYPISRAAWRITAAVLLSSRRRPFNARLTVAIETPHSSAISFRRTEPIVNDPP